MPDLNCLPGTELVGAVIKRARLNKGYTQKQLARLCRGLSPALLYQIENGDHIPNSDACQHLARVLELDERHLLFLAFYSKAPEAIRGYLTAEELPSDGSNVRLRSLFRTIGNLPAPQQHLIAQLLEVALQLMNSSRGSGFKQEAVDGDSQ